MPAPRRVLFGQHAPIYELILSRLDTSLYTPTSASLATSDLSHYDLIVPLTLDDQAALRARAPAQPLLVPEEAERLCHDKYECARHLIAHGFARLIPPLQDTPTPPYILKRKHDHFGLHSELIETQDAHAAATPRLASPDWYAQTYIEGPTEYATHLLLHRGAIRYQRTHRYDMSRTRYVKGHALGESALTPLPYSPHTRLFATLLASLGFTDGTCCIDYKIHAQAPLLFEINPRFGGSLASDINRYLAAMDACLGGKQVVPF